MFVFSGTFFPLDHLPVWAKTLAHFLPLTYAVQVARNLFLGVFNWMDGIFLMGLLLVGLGVAWLATRRLVRQILV
jgi:lipooligosaccharide transport system permease protein